MFACGFIVSSLQDGDRRYFLFIPGGLPAFHCFFDAEVVRITGEENWRACRYYLSPSPQPPPRGQPRGNDQITMSLGGMQHRFPLPQETTPPIERFTLEVEQRPITPPESAQASSSSGELRAPEAARAGPLLPSTATVTTDQVEADYVMVEPGQPAHTLQRATSRPSTSYPTDSAANEAPTSVAPASAQRAASPQHATSPTQTAPSPAASTASITRPLGDNTSREPAYKRLWQRIRASVAVGRRGREG